MPRLLLSIAFLAGAALPGDVHDPAATASTTGGLPPLHGEAVAFDPDRQRLVVVAGRTPADWLSGTWEWDGQAWSQAATPGAGPWPRGGPVIAYDPAARRMLLFGGTHGSPPTVLCETWSLERGRWARLPDDGCVIDRVRNASLVHDAKARRMLLIEGPAIGNDEPRSLRIWQRGADGWTLVDGQGPRRVGFSAAAFDAARGVLVVPVLFGGPDAGTWEWDGSTWRRVEDAPSRRQTYALAYDASRRRVVLVGGQASSGGPYLDDGWTWDGVRWSPLAQVGTRPPGRGGATLASDPRSGRLLLFGGYGEGLHGDLWSLDGDRWTMLDPKTGDD